MAGAIVQRQENSASASSTTIASGQLASNVTAGNFLWIVVTHGTSAPTTSLSKNAGTATIGAFTSHGAVAEAAVDDEVEHFTCQVTGTGTLDILATFSAADVERCIVVVEVSGVSGVDGSSEQTDTGNNPTNPSCSVTVSAQPAFGLMCLCNYQGAGSSNGTGWTLDGANMWSTVIGEGLIQTKAITSTGATTGNFANAGLDRNNSVMIVFTETTQPLKYFWSMQSLTVDYSAGATSMTKVGTSAQVELLCNGAMAPGTQLGKRNLIAADVGYNCDTASIFDRTVGSYGFLFRYRIANQNAILPTMLFVRGTVIQNHFSVMLERSSVNGQINFWVEHRAFGGGGQSHRSTSLNLLPGTIYGIVVRHDSTLNKFKIELYNPFTRELLYSYEDLVTNFNPPDAFDSTTGFQIGHFSGGGTGPSFDMQNMFVSQSYDEPIQDFLLISNYSQYGVYTATPSSESWNNGEQIDEMPTKRAAPEGPQGISDVRAWF